MKRLIISAFAAIALVAAATSMLQSQSHPPIASHAGTMSLWDLHAATDVNKLPVEEFDDQTQVYSKMIR